jgi:non-ribosomal peptide synthetase component E (peptide arylation enzyme)
MTHVTHCCRRLTHTPSADLCGAHLAAMVSSPAPALQLESQVAAVAEWLTKTLCLKAGDRVILSFPPGLKFLVAFLSCLAAGIIAGGCRAMRLCLQSHLVFLPSLQLLQQQSASK